MNDEIKERCDYLLAIINEYSDCGSCGQIVRDKSLLVPDSLNPGKYRSVCPKCNKEAMRTVFPPGELKHLFEMVIEGAEMNRPILVLVLCKTIFEVMIDGLLYRIMERRFTDSGIIDSVMGATNYNTKMKIVRDITGKNLKDLAKKTGHEDLTKTLEELTNKRNDFLHEGIATKPEKVDVSGLFQTFKPVPLGDVDVLKAIIFAIDTIDFFAKTFSDHGEWIYPFDEGDY
jgi:hypothetical protein